MKNYAIEIKWALIFFVAGLVWMFLEKIAGLHSTHIDKHATYSSLFAIPAIAIYVFALLDKKKNYYNGFMTFKQSLISGLIITLIVTVLSPFSQLITTYLITPEYFPNAIKHAVESKALTQDAAEAYFNTTNYIIMGSMFAPVVGVVTTLIVSFFVKSKNKTE